jgi:hypothetical protein
MMFVHYFLTGKLHGHNLQKHLNGEMKFCSYIPVNKQLMRKLLFLILVIFIMTHGNAQTYISLAPSISNTAGTLADKTNIGLEFGRQWDVFSLGVVVGKTSFEKMHGRDTSMYFELRPNLNVFQQGKFTNTFTAGIGVIVNAEESLMTELTSGIEYAYNDKVHFNIYFGQYYYSGRYSDSNATFFGVSVIFYFSPNNSKPLITNGRQ